MKLFIIQPMKKTDDEIKKERIIETVKLLFPREKIEVINSF